MKLCSELTSVDRRPSHAHPRGPRNRGGRTIRMTKHPFSPTARRWLDVIAYATLGAFTVLITGPVWVPPVANLMAPVPVAVLGAIVVALLALDLIALDGSCVRRAWRRATNYWRYPGIVSPALFGLSLLFVLLALWPSWALLVVRDAPYRAPLDVEQLDQVVVVILCGVAVSPLVFGLARLAFGPAKRNAPAHKETPVAPEARQFAAAITFERILEWISDDEAVTTLGHALFGHREIARRIADRIVTSVKSPERAATTAVVGELGSGKTTLGRLVSEQLIMRGTAAPQVTLAEISVWGFETPEAAVRGIVNRLLRMIDERASTLGLRGIPGAYVRIIEAGGGVWSRMAAIFRDGSGPSDVLQRIDDVLAAIDVHVVLWVEDLERFAGTANDGSSDAPQSEQGQLSAIRALLFLLDQLEHVSVIAATTSLYTRFDLEKIARYVEPLPTLLPTQVWDVLEVFREGCLRGAGTEFIDAADQRLREELTRPPSSLPGMSVRDDWCETATPNTPSIQAAMARLLHTPRKLKQALRRCSTAWQQLCGEIDFDDLLVISILRESEPDAFALLYEFAQHVRSGWARITVNLPDPPGLSALFLRFDALYKSRPAHVRGATEKLLHWIAPGWELGPVVGDQQKPQGIANDEPRDYWGRILLERVPEHEERDQDLLVKLRDFTAGEAKPLVADLVAGRHRAALRHFACRFSAAKLAQLLGVVCHAYAENRASVWEGCIPVGVSTVLKAMRRNPEDPETVFAAMRSLMTQHVHTDVGLAYMLVHRALDKIPEDTCLLPPPHDERLAHVAIEAVTTHFMAGNEDEFVHGLHGAGHIIVGRMLSDADRVRSQDGAVAAPIKESALPRWRQFADFLLGAVPKAPVDVLVPIARFLVPKKDVDMERCARMFDVKRVRDLAMQHINDGIWEAEDREKLLQLTRMRVPQAGVE